jgi:hypothetical protein
MIGLRIVLLCVLMQPGMCVRVDAQVDIAAGLKEALKTAANLTVDRVNRTDGYFGDALIKILFPEEFKPVYDFLQRTNQGKKMTEDLVLKMNRAAETAAAKARPILVDAILGITIQDGMEILKGDSISATRYLRRSTEDKLVGQYRPVITEAMRKENVQDIWRKMADIYNAPMARMVHKQKPIPNDISEYVVRKSLEGLFIKMGQEESKIRKDPAARTSDILKDVFDLLR